MTASDAGVPPGVRGALGRLLARAASQEADLPHGVLAVDPETGLTEVYGPYGSAYEALAASEAMSADFNRPSNNDGEPVLYMTVRMHPPA